MKRFKTALFLATAASSAMFAPLAQAQVTNIPPPNAANGGELRGAGSTSIQNVLVQEFNYIAKHNDLGTSGGLRSLPEPTNLPSPSGTFNCATQELEPNANAKYLAIGSGTGRTAWLATSNPFGIGNPHGTWNTVQYAFGDSPISAANLATYNSTIEPTIGGPAVQFPKYVLPVAVAYNPQYGTGSGGVALNFNVTGGTRQILGVNAGGLRLNAATYCAIFNGTITNWNDAAITADSGGTALRSSNDPLARWNNEGVPIRTVGRLDRSGTTDIFTRHLAAVCPGIMPANNKFDQAAETLPYDRSDPNAPDFSSVRSDTGLSPSSTVGVAGTINSVSSTYWNGSGFSNVANGTPATPVLSGWRLNGTGLVIVARGTGAVVAAITSAPDVPSQRAGTTDFRFNGKVGYVGADFIPPALIAPAGLFAAALKGTAGASSTVSDYRMPSAADAAAAVGAVRPPQTNASGAYDAADTARGLRTDPRAWYDALYSGTSNLANPRLGGYAISGTTQFLGYTCYKPGNLENIRNFIGWNTDWVTTDSAGNDREGVFTSSGASVASSGLLPRSNIGAMPDIWLRAITQSFVNGSDGLGLQFAMAGTGTRCTGRSGR